MDLTMLFHEELWRNLELWLDTHLELRNGLEENAGDGGRRGL